MDSTSTQSVPVSPLRVLFVHEKFGAFGGAEANLQVVAAELARRGHSVAVLHGDPTGKQELLWENTFPVRFRSSAATGRADLAEALHGFQPDLIYLHKLADLAVVEALTQCGVPVIRMVHDHDLYCMRSYKYNPLTRCICTRPASAYCLFPCGAPFKRNAGAGFPVSWVSYRAKRREIRLNRRFDQMIVATEYMRDELLRNGFAPERISIHPPVPPVAEAAAPSAFSDRNLLVFSGQLIRGKGVDVLLEALALVRQPFECVILGDGGHRPACEALAQRLGLADRVKFLGFVSRAEIARHYQAASVALVSSVWPEPFGAVGLEAMRCGLPVVGFDAGGIKEWLIDGFNGRLVPWMDRAKYAEALDGLLGNKPEARAMGARGCHWGAERHSFVRYVDGLETFFVRTVQTAVAAIPAPDL
jgi:glycosyltransferase involved in cell wall biosynthesis